eukprot:TRINITY_DN1013_c0_g1_i1.p1 TRINITY_DN1013_c0_g1~~TRINITY_DN1013_c0_g1_i1.p1  ORF type:complete len:242 (-),score=59.29 TRINITY_DN1013_c0_g1_i1:266-937(-)
MNSLKLFNSRALALRTAPRLCPTLTHFPFELSRSSLPSPLHLHSRRTFSLEHLSYLGAVENPFENGIKIETGLTGVPPISNSIEILEDLSHRVLNLLQQIPPYAHYRTHTSKYYHRILRIIEEERKRESGQLDLSHVSPLFLDAQKQIYKPKHPLIRRVEHRCRAGQVEIMIETAANELELLPSLLKTQPWKVADDTKLSIEISEFDQFPDQLKWRTQKFGVL